MNPQMPEDRVLAFCKIPRTLAQLEQEFNVKNSAAYLAIMRLVREKKIQRLRPPSFTNERWSFVCAPRSTAHDPFSMATTFKESP